MERFFFFKRFRVRTEPTHSEELARRNFVVVGGVGFFFFFFFFGGGWGWGGGVGGGSSHTSDLKFGTPVATLPGAWCYSVSAGTGWPGVSIP